MMKTEEFIPSADERMHVRYATSQMVSKLEKLWRNKLHVEIVPVGSTVKGTFISGDADLDIYVVSSIPKTLFDNAKIHFPVGEAHLSGTLLVWRVKNIEGVKHVDLVFSDSKDCKTDTLKHAAFYNTHLTDAQKDDVIRLKVLFKSHGVYGAERNGITGVALEELVRLHKDAYSVLQVLAYKPISEKWSWMVLDQVVEGTRNLVASVSLTRRRRIAQIAMEELALGKPFQPIQKTYDLGSFTSEWLEKHKDGYFLSFKRTGEAHVEFSKFLGAANSALRELKSKEDIDGVADVWVDEIRTIVAVAGLPFELSPYKAKYMCITGRKTEDVLAFQENCAWIQIDKDNIMKIVPRIVQKPQEFFYRKLVQKTGATQ